MSFREQEFPAVIDLMNGSVDHIEIVGEDQGDNFGFSVQGRCGMSNGRGVFVVGAPFTAPDTGRV